MKRYPIKNGIVEELAKQLSERELKVMLHEVIAHYPGCPGDTSRGDTRVNLQNIKSALQVMPGLESWD